MNYFIVAIKCSLTTIKHSVLTSNKKQCMEIIFGAFNKV